MPPQPKRKHSRARQGERQSHLALKAAALVECPQCKNPKIPHRACPTCGTYDGREVVEMKTKVKPAKDDNEKK